MNLLIPIAIGAIALIAMGKKKPKPKEEEPAKEEGITATPIRPAPAKTATIGGMKTTPRAARHAAVGGVGGGEQPTEPAPVFEPASVAVMIGSYIKTKINVDQSLSIAVTGIGPFEYEPISWAPWGGAAILGPGKINVISWLLEKIQELQNFNFVRLV